MNLTLSIAVAFLNQHGNWTFVQAPGFSKIPRCGDLDGWYSALEKSIRNLKMGARPARLDPIFGKQQLMDFQVPAVKRTREWSNIFVPKHKKFVHGGGFWRVLAGRTV